MTKATIRLLLFVLSMWSMASIAQEKKIITGMVKDSAGNILPGVSISEKGTQTSVISDAGGKFRIPVSSSNPVLVLTSVGFEKKEIAVGNESVINVTMAGTSNTLEGVVVTSMGISRQKKALGYSVSTIKSEELTQAGSPNFASALYGKAPGVRIGSTPGGATSAVNITIRGVNSITGKNQPLIVLDGIPIRDGEVKNNDYYGDPRIRGNGLLDINPEDIDNISILKGASAAALYGSEAVNGVVLITTKKGKGKKGFTVDVAANYSFDNVAFLPRYQNVRGAGTPFHVSNAGQDPETLFVYYDLDGDGVKETRGITGQRSNFGPVFDGQPVISWDGQIRPYEAQKNNYKGLYRTANNSSINVATSYASENSNVRFSLTRQNNQGVSLGSDNYKNIANLNGTFAISKKFTTDVMVNYINQETKNRPYSIERLMNNFTGLMGRFDNADWYLAKYKTSRGYKATTGAEQTITPDEHIKYLGYKADIADYVWRVKEHSENEKSNRVIASLTNNWQIINDLRLRARIATDFTSQRTERKQATERPLMFEKTGEASGGYALGSFQNTIVYGDVLLTYTKNITPDIEMNVMGGYMANKDITTSILRETNGGLSIENWFDLNSSMKEQSYNPAFNYRRTLVKDAFVGTINANYKGYLFVEGNLRRDRTSTMSPNNNSFVYPSVNSSFVISEAFNLPAFINYGKVRASWGIVGNYPDIYKANVAYTQNTLGAQGGASVIYTMLPAEYANDAIRPEQKHEIEFGLEAKFLDNRLGLDVSYYNGQIRDQILPITTAQTIGSTSVLTNIGTLRNKGIEIGLTGTPVKTRDFRWDIGVNLAHNKNIVEKLADGSSQLINTTYDGNAAQLKSTVGQTMGDIYTRPILTNSKGEKVVAPNGLYLLSDSMVKVGNALPKLVGGLVNTFTYKAFSLDVIIDYRYGGHVMPTALNFMIGSGLLEESLNHMDKEHGGISYYIKDGKGIQTDAAAGPNNEKVYHDGMLMEGVTADGQPNTNVVSQSLYYLQTYNWGGSAFSKHARYELYVKKNNYIKLREIALSYTIPGKLAGKVGAKRLQLSVFGRNLFYLYRTLKDLDAEQTIAGSRWYDNVNNMGTNPSTRTFGVMLRAGF
jgi:iron complex outermembrane receptor protein